MRKSLATVIICTLCVLLFAGCSSVPGSTTGGSLPDIKTNFEEARSKAEAANDDAKEADADEKKSESDASEQEAEPAAAENPKDEKSYDSGDIYVPVAAIYDENESCPDDVGKKLDEAGFYYTFDLYSPDYSGFDGKPCYVANAGTYSTEEEAEEVCSMLKDVGLTDAYVMNIGRYVGKKLWIETHYDDEENIEQTNDGIIYHNAPVFMPHNMFIGPVRMDLVIDDKTVLDEASEIKTFSTYTEGMSCAEWIANNYEPYENESGITVYPLPGFIEVSLDGSHVTTIYGAFDWDI